METNMSILPEKEPVVVPYNGMKIPVCAPSIDQIEAHSVQAAFNSGFFSASGSMVKKFEEEFAKKTGAKFGIAVNSGTSALHLAYRLIGIQQGDEVIVPDFTMVSTVSPLVVEFKATPVFVDCDQYGQIDVTKIEEKITEKTKAIVGVHIYGHPCDMDAIQAIADKHHLKVVYDSAEAHGALYKGKKMGEYGDVVCYSFYANKIITTGEGGMVTVNDQAMYDRGQRLIDEYFSEERHFWHEDLGYSFRMPNLSAALGVAQTARLEELVKMRADNNELYQKEMKEIPGISFMRVSTDVTSVYWMNCIVVNKEVFGMGRNELRDELANVGIETRTFFIPMHMQPSLKSYVKDGDTFPVAEKLCAEGLYLPSSSHILQSTIEVVASRILKIYMSQQAKI